MININGGKMRNKFILATIFLSSLLSSTWVYAHYEHYSIANQVDGSRREDIPAPCNYVIVGSQADCYIEEVDTIKNYFRSVPSRMRKKGFSNGKIARFKREQKVFEKRVKDICERENAECTALGSGCALNYNSCYYHKYHPRFLKLKHMLGEPHPVRKK